MKFKCPVCSGKILRNVVETNTTETEHDENGKEVKEHNCYSGVEYSYSCVSDKMHNIPDDMTEELEVVIDNAWQNMNEE